MHLSSKTPWTSSKQFEDAHQTRVAVQEGRKKSNKSISVGRGSWYKKKEGGNGGGGGGGGGHLSAQ